MRGIIAVVRVLAGIIAATSVSLMVMLMLAVGPGVMFGSKHQDSGTPPTLAFWVLMACIGYLFLWFLFTLIVESKSQVSLLTSMGIAAAFLGGYGLVMSFGLFQKDTTVNWRDPIILSVGGLLYGVIYWLVALKTKRKIPQ